MSQYEFSLGYEAVNKEILFIAYELYYRHWMYIEKFSNTGKTLTWDPDFTL